MGVDNIAATMIVVSAESGVNFENVITIGRQKNYIRNPLRKKICSMKNFNDNCLAENYIESFLLEIGAGTVDSLDASDYEGASVLQDLNLPIPPELKDKYTFVIDSGTMEHVLNVPLGMENIRRMTAPGGHVLMVSPANNWLGHGFYQFSPELFFRSFGPENGFQVERCLVAFEGFFSLKFYSIPDPQVLGRRWHISAKKRTSLIVLARKTGDHSDGIVQQSDYASTWKGQSSPTKSKRLYDQSPLVLQTLIDRFLRPLIYEARNRRVMKEAKFTWRDGRIGMLDHYYGNIGDYERK